MVIIRPPGPIVSFSFDDFPATALTVGGDILESAGARGTYYVALGLANKTIETGRMFAVEQIAQVVNRGHELGCHTYDHCAAWETPARRFEASVTRNCETLHRLLPAQQFATHSYPISYPRPRTKRLLASRFAACRGGGQTFNRGRTDANYLKSFFIEQSGDNLDAIRAMIDSNSHDQGWLIFSTHDVAEQPTRYGCTPTLLKEIVRYTIAAGAEILPVSLALASSKAHVA